MQLYTTPLLYSRAKGKQIRAPNINKKTNKSGVTKKKWKILVLYEQWSHIMTMCNENHKVNTSSTLSNTRIDFYFLLMFSGFFFSCSLSRFLLPSAMKYVLYSIKSGICFNHLSFFSAAANNDSAAYCCNAMAVWLLVLVIRAFGVIVKKITLTNTIKSYRSRKSPQMQRQPTHKCGEQQCRFPCVCVCVCRER